MTYTPIEIPPQQRQAIIDEENLKMLAVGFWVSAGMSAVFSLFGLFYMAMGLLFSTFAGAAGAAASSHGQAPPPEIGWIFGFIGFMMFFFLAGMAALKARAAWCLKRRRSRLLCQIVAGVNCLFIPYGTALGVYAFTVLNRPSVAAEFEAAAGE